MVDSKNRAPRGGLVETTKGINVSQGDTILGDPFNIARGLYPGAKIFPAYGKREALAAETDVPLWPSTTTYNIPPAAGVQMSFVSTSASDAAGGTNINTIIMEYLDADLVEQEEIISLNGITPVLSVATNVRFITCIHIETSGVNAFAGGVITASNGGVEYSRIPTGNLRCSSSFRMVPKDKVMLVVGAAVSSISGTSAARASINIVASEIGGRQYLDPLYLLPAASIGVQDNSIAFGFPTPFPFQAGTVVGMTLTTDKDATIAGTIFSLYEPV